MFLIESIAYPALVMGLAGVVIDYCLPHALPLLEQALGAKSADHPR